MLRSCAGVNPLSAINETLFGIPPNPWAKKHRILKYSLLLLDLTARKLGNIACGNKRIACKQVIFFTKKSNKKERKWWKFSILSSTAAAIVRNRMGICSLCKYLFAQLQTGLLQDHAHQNHSTGKGKGCKHSPSKVIGTHKVMLQRFTLSGNAWDFTRLIPPPRTSTICQLQNKCTNKGEAKWSHKLFEAKQLLSS